MPNVVTLVDTIEEMFSQTPDKRNKKEYQEWKQTINKLIEEVNKVSKLNVMFSTSFGRQLEYYTGMVFKIDIKSNSKLINFVAGGRYDGLILDLGSQKKVSAVGAAFNL